MKQVAQRPQTAAPRMQRKGSARPARRDARERQAEGLARRFVKGERGLGRLITPAVPAGFQAPGSRAESLPHALRRDLEEAFDADLSAVRLHRDPAAAAAACSLQALAFASGADVYFGAGAYDPGSPGGRELLAHELTHVLQQTGRRSADGRLAATPATGTGLVQLDGPRDLPRRFSTVQSLTRLAGIHAGAAGSPETAARIRALETTVRGVLGDELGARTPGAQTLADRADSGEWDAEPAEAQALLADVLRALRASESVAGLLFVDPELQCVLHDNGSQAFGVETVGPDWLRGQLARAPLSRWFPRRFVESFRTYLFAPRRAIQALVDDDPAFGNLVDWERRYLREVEADTGTLTENELFFLALDALRFANEERIEMLRSLEARPEASGAPPYLKRLDLAQELVRTLDTVIREGDTSGTLAVWQLVAPEVRAVAQRAVELWTAVRTAMVERRGSDLLRGQAQSPVAQQFRAQLESFADAVLARDASGRLPAPQAYNAALTRASARLRTYAQGDLEGALIRLSRQPADRYDPALAAWYGLVLAVLPRLFEAIAAYRYRDDLRGHRESGALTTLDRQWGADLRIQHRLTLVDELVPIAQAMQWQDLLDLCNAVYQARDEGSTETQLAILDDWREQTGLHIADLASGEAGLGFEADTPIRGLGFLTPRQLANVYLSEYFTRSSDAVEAILEGSPGTPGEEGQFDVDRPSIASRVRPLIEAIPRPRRYLLGTERFRLARNPADTLPVYRLVMAHPRTQAFMARNQIYMGLDAALNGALAVFPVHDPWAGGPLFFWSIPSLEPVVERLRRIPELDRVVTAAMSAPLQSVDPTLGGMSQETLPPAEEETSTGPEGPLWYRWLRAFASLGSDQIEGYGALFGAAVQAEESAAALRNMRVWRRAWIQDRQLLVRYRVRPLLEAYRSTGVDTYNHPVLALERLHQFSTVVHPEGDGTQHLTLALLELFRPPADGERDIAEELSRSGRYDLIVTWQAVLRRAIRFASPDSRILLLDLMTDAERRDAGWVDASVARMRAVEQAMERAKAQAQLRTGFLVRPRGEDDPAHPAFVALPGTRELSGAESFTINGVIYQLLSASHTVEFHPDWGTRSDLDSYRPSQLVVDGTAVEPDPETRLRAGTRELFRVLRNGRMTIVRENSDELLEELSNAVGMQSVVRSLEELEVFIEWTMNLTMDALEFVPGAGQALMAARLATSILAFIASPEFDQIREQVLEDPTGFIEGLAELVAGELFQPDRFIGWVLLSGLVPAAISTVRNPRQSRRPPPRRSGARGSAIGRFAAVMARLSQVGTRFGRSVNRMRQRAGQTFISLESYVQGHPVLALAFQMIGEFAEFLDPRVIREAQQMLARAGAVVAEIEAAFGRFPEHLGDLVASFNSLEIPRTIIPMDQVLSILIDLVIERLGSKYRLAGRGILFVLDRLGLKQQILDAIVAQLPAEANPNSYWEEFVDETLQPRLNEIRTELIAGLNRLLAEFGYPQVPPATGEAHRVRPHGSEFPEGDAFPSARPPVPGAVALPGPGRPLPRGVRGTMERQFGHDFSHVRLHTGGEAERTTRAFGADGLATGSHVYLGAGLSPGGGRGQQVLRHELAHVLQQTGPRPLAGASHAAAPRLPLTRGGVRHEPRAERAADAMAARAAARRGGPPLPVQGSRVAGWQPALSMGTVGRIVRRLSRGEALIEHYRRMDPEHGGALPAVETLPAAIAPQVANVHTAMRDAIRSMTGWPAGYTDDLREKVRAYYFGANRVEDLRHAVNRIARESIVLHRPPATAGGGSGGNPPAPEQRLSVRLVERGLEAYFLERGLGMRIGFNTEERENWTYLESSNPVRGLAFAFLNLARIGSGSDLWEALMTSNWPGATRGSDLWGRYQPWVRAYLEARGTVVGIYRTGLVLSAGARSDIEAMAVGAAEIDLAHLPTKSEYVNATGAGARNQGSGVLSLAVGRYADANQTGMDQGRDRESHHTTQFLLLEYFSNWHTAVKPFPHDLALYEPVGLSRDGNQPDQLTPATGSAIRIKNLAGSSMSARGPRMPVISVARPTHRRGRLHIQAIRPETAGDESSATQSLAVHLKFRAFVTPQEVHDALFGTQDQFTAYVADPQHRRQVRTALYDAVRSTYRWMRDDMADRLREGLRSVEVDYFNVLAHKAGRSERLTPDELGPAITRAANNNRAVMETENHWG